MKYYSLQRPIDAASVPKPENNRILAIENFEHPTFCTELGKEAWGYIEYECRLPMDVLLNHGLFPLAREIKKIKRIGIDSWGREVFQDKNGRYWKVCISGPHPALYDADEPDGEPGFPLDENIDYEIVEDFGAGELADK